MNELVVTADFNATLLADALDAISDDNEAGLDALLQYRPPGYQSLMRLLGKATELGRYHMVEILLHAGADPYGKPENSRQTALSFAVLKDDVDCLRMLTRDLFNPNVDQDVVGSDAATRQTNDRSYHVQLDKEQRLKLTIDKKRQRPLSEALLDAVTIGSIRCAEFLLVCGADMNAMLYHDDEFLTWCTPLMAAAYIQPNAPADCAKRQNADAIVHTLVERGADVNVKNYGGYTALMFAAASGLLAAVALLIGQGADVKTRGRAGRTALMYAIEAKPENIVEVAQVLISAGASVQDVDLGGWTALHFAVDTENYNLTELLLSSGAHLDHHPAPQSAVNAGGTGRAHSSSPDDRLQPYAGHNERRIDNIEDISIRRPPPPLYTATCSGNKDLVMLLIRWGADVNAIVRVGRSEPTCAFEQTLESHNIEMVRLLLQGGVNAAHAIEITSALISRYSNPMMYTSYDVDNNIRLRMLETVLGIVQECACSVPTLKHRCRAAIRKTVLHDMRLLNVLPLPAALLRYLWLDE